VELVEERARAGRGRRGGAATLRVRQAPAALARSLLSDGRGRGRAAALERHAVALAAPLGAELSSRRPSTFVRRPGDDGLRPGRAQICEIGAVRVRELELADEFQTLVDPAMPLGAACPP